MVQTQRHEGSRHEAPRSGSNKNLGNTKGDGIQGVAFLHRESRPAQPQPNSQQKRNQRPHRS